MVSVIIFILLVFTGLYLTSRPYLQGLQELNAANIIITAINRSIESLNTSDAEMDKLLNGGNLRDISYIINQTQQIIKTDLSISIINSSMFNNLKGSLANAREANTLYEKGVRDILIQMSRLSHPLTKEQKDDMAADILAAKQYSSDAKEILNNSLIKTKEQSDRTFIRIYEGRFRPQIVAVVLSILFLSFVITFGFSIIRRLKHSLKNLTKATEAVAGGDFNYEAPVLIEDEIGHLTFAFNQMVVSLKDHQKKLTFTANRISRLQKITASFSSAITPDQVFDIIIDQGAKAIGASAALISVISEEGQELILKRVMGYDSEVVRKYKTQSLNSQLPMTEAIKYSKPIFVNNLDDLIQKYPQLDFDVNYRPYSLAVVPLSVASQNLGSIAFSFPSPKPLNEEDKEYILALAHQCAQALHRSQLFEDTRKAIQARDEFLSIASHELKTPLTPLKLQLQGLARQVNKGNSLAPEHLTRIVETSDKQISRLATLIEDLLDVSRISAGKLNLNKEMFNLARMVEEIVKHYTDQLRKVQTEIQLDINTEIEGFMDKVRTEQVLINLLTNAGKYASGKPIHIKLRESNGIARLTVKDQGPGIALEDHDRIFARFERVKTKDNVGGLGLGLYISKQIIEAHGGKIYVESTPGHGSTFIVEIPLFHHPIENDTSDVSYL